MTTCFTFFSAKLQEAVYIGKKLDIFRNLRV